jgi:2-keto-4-pentenoate hydratase/2-oxohepta-3-ene-1,7-dioic acid hydratase in catechol pathway
MKLIRFRAGDSVSYGVLEGDDVYPIEGDPFDRYRIDRSSKQALGEVTLLAPVLPAKVVAVGINYRDHAEEFGHEIPDEPVLFMKPSTAVIGPDDDIVLPASSQRVDYEAELAAVVRKSARSVSERDAGEYILGYTCLNDVTARDLQRKDGQWTRAKSFDTFCPIGPWVQTDLDPNNLAVVSRLNGELRQSSNTAHFIFPLFRLFSFVSGIMTLLPGDIVTTGTPSGVGAMSPGDLIEVEVEGIGVLKNRVIAAGQS